MVYMQDPLELGYGLGASLPPLAPPGSPVIPPGTTSVVTPGAAPVAPPVVAGGPTSVQGRVWGSAPVRPPTMNYSGAAAQEGFNDKGMPGLYANWFAHTVAPFNDYYTAERGGPDQAVRDYQGLMSLWGGRTGRQMTADDLGRMMSGFKSFASALGRPATTSDLFSYVQRILLRPEPPPQIAYLRVGQF